MPPLLFLRDIYFMSKRNIKKLILKSQYISEEYEEAEDMMSLYKEEFYKEFPEEYKKMVAKREGEQTNTSGSVEVVDEEQDFEPKEEHEYSATMKTIYRRITKITPPGS